MGGFGTANNTDMLLIDQLIGIAGVLLILGIVSSRFSLRMGLPVLVLFVILGMLAGSEGLGGIVFENYTLAHAVGSLALALILFDGGLRTPFSGIELAWKPSIGLATVGVLVTAVITGAAASYILGIPLLQGLLIGSIVGSTDAAAVFSVLRSAGVQLKDRLAATLEVESGSNDPMAIFMTVAVIELLLGEIEFGLGIFTFFLMQMGVGAIAGLAFGFVSVRFINAINLPAAGLYPLLTLGCGLVTFGGTVLMGGSGFLAVYLAGIVIGNRRTVFHRGTLLFHDGLAWASQISMFVVLGLLAFPSQLAGVAVEGLAVAAVLTFVARPVAVVPLLLPFNFSWREIVLIAWVGLKGAVPIVLATYPLLYGVEGGDVVFNIVFFVVLVSAITQGWSLPVVARWLGLEDDRPPQPSVSLEITSLRDVNADIVEYTLGGHSRAAGRRLSQLGLPDGVVIAMVARGDSLIPPRGSTTLDEGDQVFVVMRPESRPLVDRVFSRGPGDLADLPTLVEFPLTGAMTVEELWESYGIRLGFEGTTTLGEVLAARADHNPQPGFSFLADGVILRVLEVEGGRVVQVGLAIPEPSEE